MENLIKINETIESIVQENDLVGELQGIEKEHGIRPSAELKKTLEEASQEGRNLKIGILGRVKAGKSSFLNALIFKGKNVLPKAATPMTAALTILEYSDKFEANIEYYTKDDIDLMRKKHDKCLEEIQKSYEAQLDKLKQNNKTGKSDSELQEKADKFAKNQLKEDISLYAYYEQYEQIKKSNIDINTLSENENIVCSNYEELSDKLKEYVGSSGKYMPFTKSITLALNEEMLKDVKIIDTPGINDPIISREERTRALIADCDAVFLVSPSGQFLNDSDLELLKNINTNNGIKEFHIVASQFDNLLNYPDIKGNGVLQEAIKRAKEPLLRQQKSVFEGKADNYDQKIYEQLTAFDVLYSSGVSIEIANNFGNLKDENAQHVLKLLTENYPDYFANEQVALSSLNTLSNMDEILLVLDNVRKEKDRILQNKIKDLIDSKKSALNSYKIDIINLISKKIEILNKTDLAQIKEQIEKIKTVKSKVITDANLAFEDSGAEFSSSLKAKLNAQIKAIFNEVSDISEQQRGSETVTKTKTIDKGAGFLWHRNIFGGRYETKEYQVTRETLNAGSIRTAVEDSIREISNILSSVYDDNVRTWRKNILKELLSSLQNSVGDDMLDPDIIKQSVRNIIANISLPEFNYDATLPTALQKSGKLVGSECDEFRSALSNFDNELKSRVNSDINAICQTLNKAIANANIGQKLINSYEEKIEQLAKDAQDKESSLAKYRSILDQLNQIEG
ncbi:dynamin family protein [Campylobacter devanensis]|uniref:dynamin family protein n=1 Tax=Campylobacter devanensis TaxID=3161138 RepID=UPI000A33AF72|nr:dynamin family protein [Campylobacter sp. P0087]